MAALNEIPGIGEASLQLLEAAGIGSAEELAAQDTDSLVAELRSANEALSASKRSPGKATVMKWIAAAMDLVEEEPDEDEELEEDEKPADDEEPEDEKPEEEEREEEEPEEEEPEEEEREDAAPTPDGPPGVVPPVNYEANAEVAEMLSRAPCAIPLPGKIMMERGLRVSDVPAGLLLNRYSGDLDVRIGDPTGRKSDAPLRRRTANVKSISGPATRRQFDASTVKASKPSPNGVTREVRPKKGHEEDRVALIRAPREETNRGKSPESRRYVRGVLHTHPWSLRLGAVFTLLLLINLPIAIVSGFLLLASREKPETFDWVGGWILAFPLALPVIGFGYLIWGMSGKCRICTQKLFVHKAALKHVKAHRFPGMGFVIPLCFHLLTFSWFRCSSCGTPVRLKK